MKERTASWVLLIVAFFWGGGFIGTRICLNSGMLPYNILFYRFLGAAVLLLIINRKKLKKISRETLVFGIIFGIITSLSYILEIRAMVLIDTNKACFLESTAMFWFMLILCFYYRVMPTGYSLLMAVCTIAGGILVGGSDISNINGDFGRGEVFALLCAAACGLNTFLASSVGRKHDTAQLTAVQMASCCIVMFFMNLTEGKGSHVQPGGLVGLLYLVLLPTFFCFMLRNQCVKYMPAVKASLILATETLFCAVMSVVLLHEVMSVRSIIGAALIIIAMVIDTLHPLVPYSREEMKNPIKGVERKE